MKSFALATFAVAVSAASIDSFNPEDKGKRAQRFLEFVTKHGLNFKDSDAFEEHLENFQRNDAYMRIFNATE